MSTSKNARIARESLEAAFACDWKRLRETYADDATMVGGALNIRGADNMVALWRGCHEEERDMRLEILNIVADQDMVAVEFYFRGIVNQPLPGCPKQCTANIWMPPKCICAGYRTGKLPP